MLIQGQSAVVLSWISVLRCTFRLLW